MAGTYSHPTTITACEVNTGFTVSNGSAITAGNAPEGTNYVSQFYASSASGQFWLQYDYGAGGLDVSGGPYVWFWYFPIQANRLGDKDDGTNPGFQVELRDTSGNYKRWNTFGRDIYIADDYKAGFFRIAIDPAATADASSGTLSASAVRYFVLRSYWITAATGLRIGVDHIAYGEGATCTGGGTALSPLDMTDIEGESDSQGYGFAKSIGPIYQMLGDLKFDSTAADIHFNEQGKTFLWREFRGASSAEQGIYTTSNPPLLEIDESGANDTNVVFGNESTELSGCIFSVDTTRPTIKINGAVTKLQFLGCTMTCDFDFDSAANPTIKNSILDNCDEYPAGTNTFEGNTIINATSGVLLTASHISKNNMYSNCTDAIHISDNGPLTVSLDGDQFSSNTDDIRFSGTGTLTLRNTNGANATSSRVTGGGTVVIENPVDLNIYVEDRSGTLLEDIRVSIHLESTDAELMNEDTDAYGLATAEYAYPGTPQDIYWRVRESPTGGERWEARSGIGQVTDGGLELTVVLTPEKVPE